MDDLDRYSDRSQDDPSEEYDAASEMENDGVNNDPSAFNPAWHADDEETSAELTADDVNTDAGPEDTDDDRTNVNSAYGWVALALSIVSFFWMPVILGAAGIIVGFIARSRGANTLGMTAIVAGAASIIISLFILPFV